MCERSNGKLTLRAKGFFLVGCDETPEKMLNRAEPVASNRANTTDIENGQPPFLSAQKIKNIAFLFYTVAAAVHVAVIVGPFDLIDVL